MDWKTSMITTLVLLGTIAIVAIVLAKKQTNNLHKALSKLPRNDVLPKAITMLVLTAQVSELVRVVQHLDIVTVSAALMLLVIIVATKQGTEGEPH